MPNYSIKEVAQRYCVTTATIRNWIKTGVLGCNTRLITKRPSYSVTAYHVEAFEKLTGATPYLPEIASTNAEIAMDLPPSRKPAHSRAHKLHNAHSARTAEI